MSLYIFDQVGTLIRPKHSSLGMAKSPTRPEEQILRPGVFEKIDQLREQGHKIAIATNQDVVAWGIITLKEAEELVENCAAKIGGVDAWLLSPYHPLAYLNRLFGRPVTKYARDDPSRKPHPGMMLELMSKLGYTPRDTIMVGDMSADRKAARGAGLRYIDAKDFFKNARKQ